MRKHGLTIDSLLAAEIVTADGEMHVVDDEHEPDLFWAIRGGGGNFGVVTRFKFRLHALPGIVGGLLVLPATADTIAGFVEAADAAPEELSTIANVMPCPPMPFVAAGAARPGRDLRAACAGPGAAEDGRRGARAVPGPRDAASPTSSRRCPYTGMYPPEDPDYHPLAITRTFFMDTFDRELAQTVLEHLEASDAAMRVAQIRVLGGAMARVPADATAFAHRASTAAWSTWRRSTRATPTRRGGRRGSSG